MDVSRFARCLLVVSGLTRIVAELPAQESTRVVVSGIVIDDDTDEPISGVRVSVSGTSSMVTTDAEGKFAFVFPYAGSFELSFRKLGYAQGVLGVVATIGDSTRVSFALPRAVQQLEETRVEAPRPSESIRYVDFDHRVQVNAPGVRLTHEDIERRNPLTIFDLILKTPSLFVFDSGGVKLVATRRGGRPTMITPPPGRGSRSVPFSDIRPCVLRVGIDGSIREWGFPLELISPKDVYGLEIFRSSAEIPGEYSVFRTDVGCGLIMVWTRIR